MTPDPSDLLSRWEAEAKEYVRIAHGHITTIDCTTSERRLLTLIKVVRVQREALDDLKNNHLILPEQSWNDAKALSRFDYEKSEIALQAIREADHILGGEEKERPDFMGETC